MLKTQRLRIHQGDKLDKVVTVRDKGQPADLTDFSATAQIRRDIADKAPTIEANIACEIGFDQYGGPDDPTLGIIRLTLPASITVGLTGRYVWDLQVIPLGGDPTTILRGPVDVSLEVTR